MRRAATIIVRFANREDADAGERAIDAAGMSSYVDGIDELAVCVDDIRLDALARTRRDVRRAPKTQVDSYSLEVRQFDEVVP